MLNTRHSSSSLPWGSGVAVVIAALSLLLAACSSPAASKPAPATTSTSTSPSSGGKAQGGGTGTTVPPHSGQVIAPGDVASIVASDTTINNRANASLSIPLQDSHETCLQQILDDTTYRGDQAASSNTLGGSFDQVPSRAFVPHGAGYPAFFSVLAEDRATSQPTTSNLLTYVKTSSSARWKLASSSEILGPTNQGVAVPAAATDADGYVTSVDPAASDGLMTAPDKVAARVAAAFTSEATSGRLPAGISAQFGPKNVADPHSIPASYAGVGTVTVQFTATAPTAAAAGAPSRDCPYPAIRLANGGALDTFAVFEEVVVHVRTGNVVVQPSDRSALGVLLPPGNYSSITMLAGDMGVAIVPPSGSRSPIEVIGQASEDLTETGVPGSGSSGSSGSGGLVDASSIAKRVDSGLVDINVTLNGNEEAAGTGMVLTSNGEVLTNNHVIEGATSISVTDVGNGKTYGARFVGYDRTSDVAVLRLENASGLQTVSLGKSSGVSSGEAVVGIGNAGGSGGTPSYAGGSVIALDQSITASDQGDGTSENLTGLIETNADIQPGDSGGPLVNSSGKVIGMDTAASAGFSFEQGGSSATQGFSIPIGTALKIAGEITSGDSSSTVHVGPTSFLGVSVVSAGGGASGAFGTGGSGFGQPVPTQTSSGAEIASVVPGSPASQAGLAEGDTITSLGGQSVTSPDLLTTIVENEKPSTSVPLVYVDSSGTRQTVTVQLASGPPQ
jgi:S1-C subfamily serine protease